MTVAIITARGGSKRLPRKNILPFCGHPLIAWTIKQAQYSQVDAVIVTTDDQEIMKITLDYADEKTHVILRPVWDDDTASNKAFHHAVEHVEQLGRNKGAEIANIDRIVALFPTSPCREPEQIDETIDLSKVCENSLIMAWFTEPRETHIFQEMHGIAEPLIRDKTFYYKHLASGTWCGTRDTMMKEWSKSFSDKELDEEMQTVRAGEKKGYVPYYVNDWQGFECDYKEWFDINEMIMEKFILKGRGIEIYDRK